MKKIKKNNMLELNNIIQKIKKNQIKRVKNITTKIGIKYKNDTEKIILKIIRLQEKLKPTFKFNFNLSNILEKKIQGFFDKIAEKIEEYSKENMNLEEIPKLVDQLKTHIEKSYKELNN